MKRWIVVSCLSFVLLITLACNMPVTHKVESRRFDLKGDRTTFSDAYSCKSTDKTILIIDEDGVATLSTTGPVFVDYINCKLDPSGFEDTYTIVGLVYENSTIHFTSCNEGGFDAKGTISQPQYPNSGPFRGSVSCIYNKGDDVGKVRMTITVDESKTSP
jgi:hypothetical protein